MENRVGEVGGTQLSTRVEEGADHLATAVTVETSGGCDAAEQDSGNPINVARRFMEEYAEVFEELAK